MSSWFATMLAMTPDRSRALTSAVFSGLRDRSAQPPGLSRNALVRVCDQARLGGAMPASPSGRWWRVCFTFPAIFPASATLIEKHVRERKEKAGPAWRAARKEAAALDAGRDARSIGLAAFAAVIWLLIGRSRLCAFSRCWLAVALLADVRRWLDEKVGQRMAITPSSLSLASERRAGESVGQPPSSRHVRPHDCHPDPDRS
jgi:hypothetical protein